MTLATHSSQQGALGAVSPAAIKQWWNSQVCTRSLPGLGKVFHTILATSGDEITSLSRIRQRHSLLFSDSPAPAKSADGPSVVGRVVGFAGSMVRGIWRAALGSASDDEAEAGEGKSVSMDETLLCQELINKFSNKVLETLQLKAGLDGGPSNQSSLPKQMLLPLFKRALDHLSSCRSSTFLPAPSRQSS